MESDIVNMSSVELMTKRLAEMEEMMLRLTNEMALLREENERLRSVSNQGSNQDLNQDAPAYETDEENLERETEWILNKSKRRPLKKRKADESPELDKSGTNNVSSTATMALNGKTDREVKEKNPPPINIVGVNDFNKIRSLMTSVTTKEYKMVSMNNNVWKINTTDIESYRTLTKKLTEEQYEWYSFENKNCRDFKVMARGIHSSCESAEIVTDLQEKGLNILSAVNIIKKERKTDSQGNTSITKRGLPLFMLTFSSKENPEKIFNISDILHMKVKMEPLKKNSNLIPQCRKCQGFNHTQKYCGREPRCVKCLGKHITQACSRNKNIAAECVNCKGEHPANYRGCEVARELQKVRDRKRKPQQNGKQPERMTTSEKTKNQLKNRNLMRTLSLIPSRRG